MSGSLVGTFDSYMQKVILSLFCPILVTIIIRVILFIIAFVLGFLGFIFNARKEYVDFVSNIGTFETFVWNESWLFWGIVVIITFVAEMIIWSVQNGTANIQEIGTNLKNSTEQLLRTESEPHTNSDNKNSIYNQSEIYKKHYEEDEKNWRNNELQAEKKKKHEEVLRKERQYLAEMQAKRIFNPIISRISLLYLAILIIPSVIMFIFFCLGLSNSM